MNKNFKFYAICWTILLVLFNVICFVTPSEMAGMTKFGGAFWSGYIFITFAFIGQLVCAYIAFKAKNLKKLFYNIPLITISYTGLGLTVIVGAACMAIPNLPNWVGIIVCMAVMAFTAISVVKASMTAELVSNVDEKVKAQTLFIKSLTVDADNLMARSKSEEVRAECKKVYEAVRYSDPMSHEALASIESQITVKFSEFSEAVVADDVDVVKAVGNELVILVGDRNKKCKLVK